MTFHYPRPIPENPSHPPWRDARPSSSWLRAWWPALLWAIWISILSTDTFSSAHTSQVIEPAIRWLFPSIAQATVDFAHHLIRKSAHFTEYFIFFVLLYHGLRARHRDRGPWNWSWALIAWLIAAAYSLLDEFHQVFVPSRGPSVWDSMLDSTGALFALLALFLIYRLFLRADPD